MVVGGGGKLNIHTPRGAAARCGQPAARGARPSRRFACCHGVVLLYRRAVAQVATARLARGVVLRNLVPAVGAMPKRAGGKSKRSSAPSITVAHVVAGGAAAVVLALALIWPGFPKSRCSATVSGHACTPWGENAWGLEPDSTMCEQVDGLDRPWCFHTDEDWDYCAAECGRDGGGSPSASPRSLRQAVEAGDVAAIQRLVAAGHSPHKQNEDGDTVLILAARAGQAAAVKALIAAGADTELTDRSGFTALMAAALQGHTDVAKELIKGGAKVDTVEPNGWTALHQAARYGHTPVIQVLLDGGSSLERKTNDGWPAMTVAAYTGQSHAARVLIAHGAAVQAKHPDGSINREADPLWIAVAFGYCEVAKVVLTEGEGNGASIEARDAEGNTVLMSAARHERADCISVLVELGADINGQNDNGWTALMVRHTHIHPSLCAHCFASERLPWAQQDAAWHGKERSVRMLLQLGANALIEENDGRTARKCAEQQKHVKLAKLLREAEAAHRA